MEITDSSVFFHRITNTANALDVEEDPEPVVVFISEVVNEVPHIDFDLSRDLVLSKGQVMVADYIDDYCDRVGFYQEDAISYPSRS
ncbi:hypothetical protein [Kyrpidia tusciae]|uniref:Uncharacterized protein n=1 Tax=Kyrpidia tusciae (strain DSM 2912 / NBRC 15312 / T2) TaxID=562970 RepID=D5WVN9_KYRT2|nr:hypothetical protein [Kyrpidia tusciae]ADG07582.1 hypothetical protein Btus_2951 [Kyrpidia tusciae DSM 2912]